MKCFGVLVIERYNGEDAFLTLSEGERNFIVFLYFYHLIKGSFSKNDIENDMVVVIDDPVSSLDNDILFIISTLIRNLWKSTDFPYIKQFFILTLVSARG
jgi:wobble nucleotide-excising tRNase